MNNKFKGRGVVQMTGRQLGKSYASQAYQSLVDAINRRPVEELKLNEGKVYGARYYTVEPIGGSWLDMETWCFDTFGTPGASMWGGTPEPAQRWYMNNRKFWFRSEKDRLMFILKWR
jgi:hypothetical protein